MRIFIWCVLCSTLMPQGYCYIKGSLESYTPQKILVLNDYSICLRQTPHLSVKQLFTHEFLCVKYKLLHCIFKDPIKYSRGLIRDAFQSMLNGAYCGAIWIREKPILFLKKDILVQATQNHNIHMNFLQFRFFLESSMFCHQHGVVLSSPKFESESYCGSRIPWSIITKGNTLVLHLTITKYKKYVLQVYYSSFHTNWISDISSVLNIYNDDFLSFNITRPYSRVNIISYRYYIMSHPDTYIQIRVHSNTNSEGHFIIRDGPGSLSPIILESKDSHTTDLQIETSAYWAFIHLRLFDVDIKYLPLQITTAGNIRDILSCANHKRDVIVAKSNIWKNTVCIDSFYSTHQFHKILVKTFLFAGPNMVTDLSDSVCQYGGLLVQFNGRMKEYGFCESLDDYAIHTGENVINVILIWFVGYSHGSFTGLMQRSDCKSYHAEPSMVLNEPLYQHFEYWSTHACRIFVAPPLVTGNQPLFNIKLGPRDIGPAYIQIKRVNTLSPCEPEYSDMKQNNAALAIETISLNNWPLNVGNIVSSSKIPFLNNIFMAFVYLESVNISLPYICTPKLTRVQLAVIIHVSACISVKGKGIKVFAANNIPILTGYCNKILKSFKPTGTTGSKLYKNFIYKDRRLTKKGNVHPGHEIQVEYEKCPMECRNYKYSTFVKMENEKTVFEYTTRVGHATSTGRYHKGFRVSILPPDKLCHQHMHCVLKIFINKLLSKDSGSDPQPSLHYYGKR